MKAEIIIQNLKCGGCAHTITTKISSIENISNVVVAVESSSVSFDFLSDNDLSAAKSKLTAIGYPEEGDVNSTLSKAKSFVSCATGKMTK